MKQSTDTGLANQPASQPPYPAHLFLFLAQPPDPWEIYRKHMGLWRLHWFWRFRSASLVLTGDDVRVCVSHVSHQNAFYFVLFSGILSTLVLEYET